MATDKPGKKRSVKLRAGKRTARTSGMSQSAFAGYATPPAPPPEATKSATPAAKADSDKKDSRKKSDKTDDSPT